MKTKFLVSTAILLILTTMGACSQAPTPSMASKEPTTLKQTEPGSYIVNASGDGDETIRRVFAKYGVELVRPLGNKQFELRLQRDPGLDALKSVAADSGGQVTAVQPNFVYHTN